MPVWVQTWSWITVGLATILMALGGFVTSFRVGMADPVWPTEPWFLLSNRNLEFGFLVEHTHRLAAWIVGLAVTVLALGVWRTEPDRKLRTLGFVALVGLLIAFGEFHRGFRGTFNQIKDLAKTNYNLDPGATNFDRLLSDSRVLDKVDWPWLAILLTLAFFGFALSCGIRAGLSGRPGGWLRAAAVISLTAVMVQGLFGGFRVLLNALMGTNLAAIHGAFGQVAFSVFVAVAVLGLSRRFGDSLAEEQGEPLAKLSWSLVAVLFVQLIWAVWLRHTGGALAQRLHLLTAFVATGLMIWMCVRILNSQAARFATGKLVYLLLGLLVAQLLFGVEAYLGKFAAIGTQAQVLPEMRLVSGSQAAIRTTHQLIGCGLLATAVALALVLSRRPVVYQNQPVTREGHVPDMAALAMLMSNIHHTHRDGALPDVAALALVPLDDGGPPVKDVPDVATMAVNPQPGLLR
ncbi:hypothetical protein BH11PLA2_BH11PLA2_11850 [soil metagenome]